VAEEYVKIMNDCEVTISKEKSLISSTGALEFAKKFITDEGSMDLSPVSLKVLNIFSGFAPAFHFRLLGVNLRTSIRLRGGGYPVYNNEGIPKGSRRWLRHWLLVHSPSGLHPYPIDLWLTLPEKGSLDPYRFGRVMALIIKELQPKSFSEREIDGLRLAYDGDDELFEVLLQQWILDHLNYVRWYYLKVMDPYSPLEFYLKPLYVCHSPLRVPSVIAQSHCLY